MLSPLLKTQIKWVKRTRSLDPISIQEMLRVKGLEIRNDSDANAPQKASVSADLNVWHSAEEGRCFPADAKCIIIDINLKKKKKTRTRPSAAAALRLPLEVNLSVTSKSQQKASHFKQAAL